MNLSRCLLSSALIATLVGCSASSNNNATRNMNQSPAKVLTELRDQSETDTEYSQKLARMGEILINGGNIEEGNRLLDMALAQDSENAKANFLSAITTIAMTAKGGLTRVAPLYKNGSQDLANAKRKLSKSNVPEWTTFALTPAAGKKNISNISDVQNTISNEIVPAFESAIAKLRTSQKNEFKIILTGKKYEEKVQSYCNHYMSNQGIASSQCYDYLDYEEYTGATHTTIDQHDAKVIEGVITLYLNYLRIYNAYDLSDMEAASTQIENLAISRSRTNEWGFTERGSVTAKESAEILNSYPKLLTLRSNNGLDKVAGSLANIAEIALSFEEFQTTLCGSNDRGVEENNNLIKQICLSPEDLMNMETALSALQGPQRVQINTTGEWDYNPNTGSYERVKNRGYSIVMNISQYLNNPVSDLKTLLPTRFDANGEASGYSLPNKTINGLFPNGDIEQKVRSNN